MPGKAGKRLDIAYKSLSLGCSATAGEGPKSAKLRPGKKLPLAKSGELWEK
jgi:hypothetical protein